VTRLRVSTAPRMRTVAMPTLISIAADPSGGMVGTGGMTGAGKLARENNNLMNLQKGPKAKRGPI